MPPLPRIRHAAPLALLLPLAVGSAARAQEGGAAGASAEAGKAPLKAVVFAIEPVDLPQTPAMRGKLADATALLRRLVADKGYAVVDTAPQQKQIADNLPLSQCNGCDVGIAKALGADIEFATAVQQVSAATYSLSGSVKDVRSDRVLRQGVVDMRGADEGVWSHGVKYLVRDRLFEPPLPTDAAALRAAVTDAGKTGDK